METKRFRFYTSKISAYDILKGIFLYADRDKTYSCNPHKYSVFFRDAADKFPELFEDVFIEKDPFLPYSEDIERAYSSAIEFNIIVRPNPDTYPCRIVADRNRLEKDVLKAFTEDQLGKVKELASLFERTLQEF